MRVPKALADKIEAAGEVQACRLPVAACPAWAAEFAIPCVVVSEPNRRDHWAVKARRRGEQTAALCAAVFTAFGGWIPPTPCLVTFTRSGPRPMDSDNLAGAFKGLRDSVARWLGVDDGDESKVAWAYRQEKGPAGVRVRIESRA
jgi:hypothetical protein